MLVLCWIRIRTTTVSLKPDMWRREVQWNEVNNWSPNQTPNKQKWQKIVLRPSSDSQKQEIVVSIQILSICIETIFICYKIIHTFSYESIFTIVVLKIKFKFTFTFNILAHL